MTHPRASGIITIGTLMNKEINLGTNRVLTPIDSYIAIIGTIMNYSDGFFFGFSLFCAGVLLGWQLHAGALMP